MRRAMQAASRPAIQAARPVPVAAPVGGWNTRDSIAAMPKTDALLLDNWIVRPGKVSMRKGQRDWSTGLPGTVETVMPWNGGSGAKLFAATSAGIFDATVAGAAGTPSSAATNGRWQFVNYANSVSQWLACVNGQDPYRYYDGTTWTTQATFSYTDPVSTATSTIPTGLFASIASYQKRLFFTKDGSLDLWFLDIGAITGEVFSFPLSQLAYKGGYLQAIATWTVDGGDGVDDLLAMATSEGQVIVYRGIDPTVSDSWTLQGVYDIGRPLGARCFSKYGGDLLYLSERGLLPMSKVLQTSSLDHTTALSDKINTSFTAATSQLFGTFGWEICQHNTESFFLVNVPSTPAQQFVMDFQSKSWSRFLGMQASCWAFFRGSIYYGTVGRVVQAYSGASDFGGNIVGEIRTAYNYFGSDAGEKQLGLVRPSFSASGQFNYSLNCSTDFDVFGGSSNITFPASSQARWDSALWDESYWSADYYLQNRWETVFCWPFYAMSLGIRVSTMSVLPDLIAVDYTFQGGGLL